MPRVVSGIVGGIVLDAPNGRKTRPTSDRAKEALFSIISRRVEGSRFLDIFAGTGQMGIEALSRGAQYAAFIDSGHESIRCIKDNLKKCGLTDKADIYGEDVFRMLGKISPERRFDLVYIDPPYADAMEAFRKIGSLLERKDLISDNVLIMLEHDSRAVPDDFVTNLKLKRCCKYGTVMISFYERSAQNDEECSTGGGGIK